MRYAVDLEERARYEMDGTDDEFEESDSFHKSPKRSKRVTKIQIKPSQSSPVNLTTDDEFEESDTFHKSPKRSKSCQT